MQAPQRAPVVEIKDPESDASAQPGAGEAERRGPGLVILDCTADHVLGWFGNVMLYCWRGETTQRAVAACELMMQEGAASGSGKFGLLGAAEPQAALPPSELRGRLAQAMRAQTGHLVASAFVFEGDGFRAAAMRSVATGLTLIARQPYPHKIFATTRSASLWLFDEMNEGGATAPGVANLAAAFARLRYTHR